MKSINLNCNCLFFKGSNIFKNSWWGKQSLMAKPCLPLQLLLTLTGVQGTTVVEFGPTCAIAKLRVVLILSWLGTVEGDVSWEQEDRHLNQSLPTAIASSE